MTLEDITRKNFSWLRLDQNPFGERIILTEQAKHRLACCYGFIYGVSLIRKDVAEKMAKDLFHRIDYWMKRSLGEEKVSIYSDDAYPLHLYPKEVCKLRDDGCFMSFTYSYLSIVQTKIGERAVVQDGQYVEINGKQIMYKSWMYGGLIYHGPEMEDEIKNHVIDTNYNYWGMHT